MSQKQQILRHIKAQGSISLREALMDYSIQSLTARIAELRRDGYRIKTMHCNHPVTGQPYARYVLK
jgi:DNA-binding HxlR family transcriptional regulator